ncbi:MurR/RpiR family transcriptional regulator [Neobacillus sp. OS1-32]|jgi:RpiR family glv operon transcriptional regulator|uniref:MurR/RpiR family transcriptional regulator n=1 Tax=Neobacillus paridis TaxID=2803862 RepID=A0ABS1TTS0_9BACI|nr:MULTISPECIES: MurR/RpiR family transcriptional regulator [Neobacillus]MBL4953310.1 MurR/RpiR family transcriptional regulator [Neobacillus paridis]WML29600.1 MurR/RpiR family transcriptional regulator [Neobacillus sp. OS1-32]
MDFFEITAKHIHSLNLSEKDLYKYIIRNMEEVRGSTIRELAAKCYVSPATIIRFLRKIGFSGYSEFIAILKYTDTDMKESHNPFVVPQEDYRIEYLKNIYESVRVLDNDKVDKIIQLLKEKPRLIVMARGLNKSVAHYFEYVFSGFGFEVIFPEDHYFRQMLLNGIRNTDLVFFLTYGGEDKELIREIELLNIKSKATVVSITSANNNPVQNMSHINLYVFADCIQVGGIDMTSRISMIAIIELLAYKYMEEIAENKETSKHISNISLNEELGEALLI